MQYLFSFLLTEGLCFISGLVSFQKIYLPGDNDIGGEDDRVSPNIHKRFNFAYTQPDTLVYKTVTFFKVNTNPLAVQSLHI